MTATHIQNPAGRIRIRIGLTLVIVGQIVFILGADPGLFGLDRSPVTGFIQIAVLSVGLAAICLGGYMTLNSLWNGYQKTIAADVGLRLVATGYVIAVSAGMADVFGFGTHILPVIPYFGPLQAIGVMIGEIIISIGFVMLIPYQSGSDAENKPASHNS